MDEAALEEIVSRVLQRLEAERNLPSAAGDPPDESRRVERMVGEIQQSLSQLRDQLRNAQRGMERRALQLSRRLEETQRGLREVLLELRALARDLAEYLEPLPRSEAADRRDLLIDISRDEALRAALGILLHRGNSGPAPEEKFVDCAARWEICQGACCFLGFSLTWEEVQRGAVAWDERRPFHIQQNERGYCVHWDVEQHTCRVYEERPVVCRIYSCEKDRRIWLDFENKVLHPRFQQRLERLYGPQPEVAEGEGLEGLVMDASTC
jgi:Fe-S-cluster containining protein